MTLSILQDLRAAHKDAVAIGLLYEIDPALAIEAAARANKDTLGYEAGVNNVGYAIPLGNGGFATAINRGVPAAAYKTPAAAVYAGAPGSLGYRLAVPAYAPAQVYL